MEPAAADTTRDERGSGTSGDLRIALGLGLLVAGCAYLFARSYYDNYDGNIMGQVAGSLIHDRSVVVPVDGFHLNSPYSFYGIGMSLLMLPTTVLANVLGATDAEGAMATNAWLLGVLAAVVFAWCRLSSLRANAAAVVALVVAFGAGLLPFASTGFGEVGLAIAIALGMLGLTATLQERTWGPALAGAAAGWAVLIRDDSAVLVVPWLVVAAWTLAADRAAAARKIALGALPFALVWAWYNNARFGAPWKIGHSGVLEFNHPFLDGLYGLVLSPGRGVLLYVPLVAVAVGGLARAWRRHRTLVIAGAGLLLSRIVFYAPYWGWYGGGTYGPRYVLPAAVVLTLGLIEVARAWPGLDRRWRTVAAAVAAVSIGVGLAGAAIDYQRSSLLQALRQDPTIQPDISSRQAYLDFLESRHTAVVIDRSLFDWTVFPVTDQAADLARGRNVASAALGGGIDFPRCATVVALVGAGLLLIQRRAGQRRGSSGGRGPDAERDVG